MSTLYHNISASVSKLHRPVVNRISLLKQVSMTLMTAHIAVEFVAIKGPVLLKLLKLFKFHLTSLCCRSPFLNPMHDFVRLASPTVDSFQM